jgi:hypothetical protein
MPESCKDEIIPYLFEMNSSAKKTIHTGMETGFTVAISPDGTSHIEHVEKEDYSGLLLKRPIPPDKPFIHFHTHVTGDPVKGLSGGDTLFPFFNEYIYPYHCVASTGYKKIFCYRPKEVIEHPRYKKTIQEQKDLSMEHAKIVITKCPNHSIKISNMLQKNQLTELMKYERRYCPEATIPMRKMMTIWNDFIPQTKCTEFPIKED